jgi:malonyl-CoA O-methyltransferase
MSEHAMGRSVELDKQRIRRAFAQAAASYDRSAVLQRAVGEEILSRLELIKLMPRRILDVGCGTGTLSRALQKRYRRASVVALDLAFDMVRASHVRRGWFSHIRCVNGDAEAMPVASDSVDMIVSNLVLQWCDPEAVFREFARVLRPGGLLMFTTFGPDTLRELRAAWYEADPHTPLHEFADMHDLGDQLLQARLAEPVMDVERYTLTYDDPRQVLRDLKAIGARNATRQRRPGLTGKQRFTRFQRAYEAQRTADGRIPASYEVVFGHAWAPVERAAGTVQVAMPVGVDGKGGTG